MSGAVTPKNKATPSKQYGNVAKLTPQQELFAIRMDQMRKEAA